MMYIKIQDLQKGIRIILEDNCSIYLTNAEAEYIYNKLKEKYER